MPNLTVMKDAFLRPYERINRFLGLVKFVLALGSVVGTVIAFVAAGPWAAGAVVLAVAAAWGWSSALMAQSELFKARQLADANAFKVSFQFVPAEAPYDPLSSQMGEQTRSVMFNVINDGNRPYRVRAALCSRTVHGVYPTDYPQADQVLRMQSPAAEVVTVGPGATGRIDLAYLWPNAARIGFLSPDNERGPYSMLEIVSANRVVTGTVRVVDDDTGESTLVHFVLDTDPAHHPQLRSEQFTL